jgi:hypothetical protein
MNFYIICDIVHAGRIFLISLIHVLKGSPYSPSSRSGPTELKSVEGEPEKERSFPAGR